MKILIEGECLENYFAKVHEACRAGLCAMFDAKCYGKGYPYYDAEMYSFLQIKQVLFGDTDIDLILLTDCWNPRKLEDGLCYQDLDRLKCKKAIMLCDFWSEAECQREKYIAFINKYKIDYIFSYFRAPFHLWSDLEIGKKLIWYPPCFNPHIFNDWKCEKKYDVGNLNAGIFQKGEFYPERFNIHQKLLQMDDIKYYYEKHPGTGMLPPNTALIGKSFSEAINSCRIFVTTGNLEYRNFTPKYVEIMASGALLFANEPLDAEVIGLEDGINYININEDNIQDKLRYYLLHEEERKRIIWNAYKFVFERYSCYSQTKYVLNQIMDEMGNLK